MTLVDGKNTPPRPTAFKAVIFGSIAFNLVLFIITKSNEGASPFAPPPWLGMVQILLWVAGLGGAALMWFRQGVGFHIYTGHYLVKIALTFMLLGLAGLPFIIFDTIIFGLLFWTLHIGGAGSMWSQMFGHQVGGGPGAYGFRPAMPPVAARPPVAPTPVTPGPAMPPAPPAAARPPAAPAYPPAAPAAPAAAPVAAPAAPGPQLDPFEQIKKLALLRDAGVLTAAEFDAKKAELLKRL